MKALWLARLALLALTLSSAAQAHQSSDAFISWRINASRVEQRVDIALRDLDRELSLDANDDGQLSWGEVRGRWPEIERLLADRLRVSAGGRPCSLLKSAPPQLDEHSDGRYAVLQQTLECAAAAHSLGVDYRLFADSDAGHRGIVRLLTAAGEQTALLVPAAGARQFQLAQSPQQGLDAFGGFVKEGMQHIAAGLDHILFLLTLLMVTVWRREGRAWVARATARSAWQETLRLVTAFTLAHSLTLGLAAAGLLAPPSRWIESLIAASVLIAALDNLRPFVPGPRWLMVALFGLVHGFGFAGPLQALGLQRGNLALPLLGFNLGVELGQLLLVLALLPLACAWRAKAIYVSGVVRLGSGLIAGLALIWLIERSLDLSVLS